jgi:murein peptide amidase A
MVRRALAASLFVVVLLGVLPPAPRPTPSGLVHNKRVRLGRSVDGRAVRAVQIGDASSDHTVLVFGAIHGNETAGLAIINALRRMRPIPPADVWIVRDLNPDGRAAGTRQNGRGVDLNRNFGFKWRPIGERWDTYHSGPRRFSEPESRMAKRFILELRPDITIWYHQAMELVDESGGNERIPKRYARLVGLPFVHLKRLPGTATRWQNHTLRKSTAFVVELPAGPLGKRSAKRHARAVVKIARMANS